ncbi:MAG: Grx4 family monothiol glutaredoxin [Bradymonadaceae bacterium]
MTEKKKGFSLPLANPEAVVGDDAGTGGPKSRAEGGDIMTEIEKEVTTNKLVLYMKGLPAQPMCGFSATASAILGSYGVPLFAVNILADPEKRQAIKEFSKWPTIPQVYVGGEFLGGSDILMQMHESGELKAMIEEAFGKS